MRRILALTTFYPHVDCIQSFKTLNTLFKCDLNTFYGRNDTLELWGLPSNVSKLLIHFRLHCFQSCHCLQGLERAFSIQPTNEQARVGHVIGINRFLFWFWIAFCPVRLKRSTGFRVHAQFMSTTHDVTVTDFFVLFPDLNWSPAKMFRKKSSRFGEVQKGDEFKRSKSSNAIDKRSVRFNNIHQSSSSPEHHQGQSKNRTFFLLQILKGGGNNLEQGGGKIQNGSKVNFFCGWFFEIKKLLFLSYLV